ncbi:AAA family ATPase [Pedobacter frigoris]|uniref:AAA family ATPase n=1 Tax=Pedobacter frigoris TaxID=2571272 RepID=UPI00292F065F|nr:AAA family ATPase [Pedobacter frigoris]
MAKIKNVTIENFRAYEGTHDFSFLGSGGLANLVVIYAPNGYGKTSFFDAVEWAFSNKIRRFENGVLKQELDSKDFASDDQIILTNRSGYYKGEKGEITITTDEDKIIKRTIVPRQIPNTDIKTDYRDVPLLGNYTQNEINLFSENNMLTQDQIDSFLRFKTPEEKFNALKEFWPEGSEASSVFATLTSYTRILRSRAVGIQHNINKIVSEIDENINSDANFSKINNWILQLNAAQLIDIKFPEITQEIDDEVYLSITQSNETYKLVIDTQIANAEIAAIKYTNLGRLHPKYLEQISELSNATNRLKEMKQLSSSLETLHRLRNNYNDRSLEITRLNAEKSGWERLINLWPEFAQDKSVVQSLQSDNFKFYQEIEEKSKANIGLEEEVNETLSDRNLVEFELKQEQAIASKIEVELRQIEKLSADIKEGRDHQEYSEACIAEIRDSISQEYLIRRALVEMLESENYSNYEHPDGEFNFYLTDLLERETKLSDINGQILHLETEIGQKGSFSDNLSRLVKWASTQVLQQNLSSCPMCNTTFSDVDKLLEAITADKGDILKVSDLELELETHYLIKSYLMEDILEADSYLNKFINNEVSRLNKEIGCLESSIDKLQSTVRNVQDSIDHASIVISHTIEQITTETDSIDFSIPDPERIRKQNRENINKLTSLLKTQNENLNAKNNQIKTLNNNLLVLRNAIANNGNKASLIQAKQSFIECSDLLEKKLLKEFTDLDLRYLKNQLQLCLDAIKLKSDLNSEQVQTIGDLENELQKSGNSLSELQANELAHEAERQQSSLILEKERFESAYRALISDEKFILESIQEHFNRFNTRQQNLVSLREQLNAFGFDLAVIEGDVARNRLKKELSKLKIDLAETEYAANRIETSKTTVGDFITKGVDEYFNKDVINQIYSKIEPHPKLTEIDIRAESSGRLPRLTIRAKSDTEELAPGLFLSTGQVNVLSLSIFIARAYEMGNGNFDCIFMDDPVQNMSDINVLSFVDLLRILIHDQDKQVMISTHDEKFFKLLQNKLPSAFFKSKFFELGSYGRLKEGVPI